MMKNKRSYLVIAILIVIHLIHPLALKAQIIVMQIQAGDDNNLIPVADDVLIKGLTQPLKNPNEVAKAVFQYASVNPDGIIVMKCLKWKMVLY